MKSKTAEIIDLQSIVKKEENLLPNMFFNKLKDIVEGYNFQWYFQNATVPNYKKEPLNNFMFTHNLYNDNKQLSNWFPTFEPILYYINEKYKINQLLRMKLNLYTNQHKKIKHGSHQDFPEQQDENIKIGLFNFTTCDGETNIDKKIYKSKKNELIVFNNTEKHYGITQTNTPTRIMLNIGWK